MAKVCDICKRGKTFSHSRSKSNIATKRTHELNLQTRRIKGKKSKVCTKCLKTLSKVK
ncbi:50S ribosomal protein L28 [Patescibacteria group bacterium]|nr:50S ribosomal protein L28 [Patescibacteria group bacterium]MBU1922330.1 50S ribosomal protein L28 [Patescibacteria group bacterium]